ncbi:DUF397 domain-containing protein [Streptomyces clavuligerus]|uniref:DUF397 domain-containing protein n=1 Tax=Streptomyces clavuligerus TaxID=1901 RepID=B5GXV6_STRCL|nr:DUF397 domain-containing protein [Streptomyces clavuligerus]AXU14528.1 DUF397 domain-containing protein [Streptomyces clavuligerus]EDY51152.1 hypothetical protein SSCG_04180 [Streptomyces clavuligerus]EFG07217.1 DUF397 domain-containing protein [Streptomyces clavuligerus]MBY6304541.1 DUF397 domain-containing protein [Streptomyces clavuligerus]QCS07302.1 DUF397 domain-containing protein [Streptomyces clavuligerus]
MNRKDPHSAQWRKSSYSNGNGNCVEVRLTPGTVAARDSKVTRGPEVTVGGRTWSTFVRALQDAQFPGA